MDKKQIRPYTLEEEKILREGLDETIEVTYENVATLSVEDPFANLKVESDNSLPQDKTEEEIIYSYENRDTENDPFKGTSIEGKD